MKRKGLIMAGVMMLLLAGGCGRSPETDAASLPVESIPAAARGEENAGNADQIQSDEVPGNAASGEEAQKGAVPGTTQLEGNVVSIGDNSVVISQSFTEKSKDGEVDIMWAPAEDSEDEVLVNVIFTEDTRYEYKTVKNSGINPEDVESRAGTFQDIGEGLFLSMKGSYQGNDFYAAEVSISEFIR